MNVARKLSDTDTYDKKADPIKGSEAIHLVGRDNEEDKKVSLEYLNEKLAYFYNNGGPIMDI